MFVKTEETSNPQALKFLPTGKSFNVNTPYSFENIQQAKFSPLGIALFSLIEVESVYISNEFITITKKADVLWDVLKIKVIEKIILFFDSNENAVNDQDKKLEQDDDTLTEIEKKIVELLETKVRPSVAQDGGDITLYKYEEGIAWLKMQGACAGCPSSTITLKQGVENMLRYYVPEVEEVRNSIELEMEELNNSEE